MNLLKFRQLYSPWGLSPNLQLNTLLYYYLSYIIIFQKLDNSKIPRKFRSNQESTSKVDEAYDCLKNNIETVVYQRRILKMEVFSIFLSCKCIFFTFVILQMYFFYFCYLANVYCLIFFQFNFMLFLFCIFILHVSCLIILRIFSPPLRLLCHGKGA